ncbi:FGGY family carbohydrate kinase, partial [Pseudactinotalea sp.]|uniref:FGGY family carbohydrate kinase n=1 Tax=Pseudactinotalea sp. TaxID=1926260 RepID=UPI003B3BB58D
MRTALIGIDIGTSSTKGVLVDPDGTVLRQHAQPHTVSRPHPGWAEQDALDVWWADVVDICHALADEPDTEIMGVGITGLGPCMLPLDAQNRPLRPAILYAVDTRAMTQVEEVNQRYGEELVSRCGHVATSQSVGPKILWLAEHEPDVFARTARVVSSTGFVVERLTGAYVVDHLTASMFDPFYDLHEGAWIREWAEPLIGHIELPELCWPGDVIGQVSASAAAETGLPAGVPVVCGTMDFWAENVSVGADAPGDCMLAYGTTMSVSAVVDRPAIDPMLGTAPASGPGAYHVGGATAAAGALTDWTRQLTAQAGFEQLLELAAQVAPGADGV